MIAKGDAKSRSTRSKSKQFTFFALSLGALALLFGFRPEGNSLERSDNTLKRSNDQRLISSNDKGYKQGAEGNMNNIGERRIRQISLIGERNSGTRWSWQHLSECFNHSIPVSSFLAPEKSTSSDLLFSK